MINDLRRLFHHSLVYTIGSVFNRLGAFLLLPLYTHYLTVAQYGQLELFYSFQSVTASLLSIGLAHATLRFFYEYEHELDRRKVVSTNFLAISLVSVPAVLALSLANYRIAALVFGSVTYRSSLNVLYAIIVVGLSKEIGLGYLRAREYSALFVVVSVVQLVTQIGVCIYTVGVLRMGIYGVLIGNLASESVAWLIAAFVTIRECGLHFDWQKLKAVFAYSYPFLLSSIVGVLVTNADRFILRSFASMESLGIYSLAVKFGLLMQVLFLEPINLSFGAFRFSIMRQENAQEMLAKIMKVLVMGSLWLGVGISTFSRPVLRIMTAPGYHEAYKLVPIVVLPHAFSGLTYLFQTGILFKKQTRKIAIIAAISGAVQLAANFLLIPRFAEYGAAWSQVLPAMIAAGLTFVISARLYPIKYEYGKVAVAYAIGFGFLAASRLSPFGLSSLFGDAAWGVVLSIAYPVLLWVTRALTKEDAAAFKQLVEPAVGKMRLFLSRKGRKDVVG